MINVSKNFAELCCVFDAGSSLNGEEYVNDGSIYQGVNDECSDDVKPVDGWDGMSPLCLSKRKGTKIDFIRVMNAWFECGKVEAVDGGRLTKKEFFSWVGKLFNIDLTDYDRELVNALECCMNDEKQTHVFDELKRKHQIISRRK